MDLPSGFYRAEQSYLYNTPENSIHYDDWCDGRDELKDCLDKYFKIMEAIPIEPETAEQAEEYYSLLVSKMCELRILKERIWDLQEQYPAKYEEPEPDFDSMDPDN